MSWRWWTTHWLVIQMWCVKLCSFQSSRRHASLYNLKILTSSTMDNDDQSKEKYKSLKLWNKITQNCTSICTLQRLIFSMDFQRFICYKSKNIFNKINIDTIIPKNINKILTSSGAFDESIWCINKIMSIFL